MNCKHAHRLFGAYWDDEVTQAEREWLESHFSACASCRAEYDDHARTLEALSTLPRTEAAPGMAERVLARARRASTVTDRLPGRSLAWVPVTAAVVAALLVAGTLVGPWLATGPRMVRSSRLAAAPTRQPQLVTAQPVRTEPTPSHAARTGTEAALAAVPDSLFDHSEDVEFILDPVTLRRGRPAVARPTPRVQGQQATITF
jgi:hypothetical protein